MNGATVASADAKANFSELLDRVVNGEEISITRHDNIVARLVPAKRRNHVDVNRILDEIGQIRRNCHATMDELMAWKNHGRR